MGDEINWRRSIILGGAMAGLDMGNATNPAERDRQPFIEINGEKLVCLAKGGECRLNNRYYSFGMSDEKSWTTPIIDKSCPEQCGYRMLVCDDHPKDCIGSKMYYPQHNKFRGRFERYCRNFERLKKGDEDGVRPKGTIHSID